MAQNDSSNRGEMQNGIPPYHEAEFGMKVSPVELTRLFTPPIRLMLTAPHSSLPSLHDPYVPPITLAIPNLLCHALL